MRLPKTPPPYVAALIAFAAFVAFAATAPKGFFSTHTAFNHYALLAEGWLHGRTYLEGPPPEYTQFNDFALYQERFYVSFPPFPAVLLLPFVAIFGGADKTPDGLVFLFVAAAAPAILYLALERMRARGLGRRSWIENVGLALLLPFATVFWFTAVQGTVWFAAHVVGVALLAGYLWASVGAERPLLAGTLLVLAFATRPPMALAGALFALEIVRRHREGALDMKGAGKKLLLFAAPIAIGLVILAAYNEARFDDPFEFGHRHLAVVWQKRMQKWGLFSLHYLGKNLGVMLAGLPFVGEPDTPWTISGHGLALWITSPFLVFALWPRSMPRRDRALFVAIAVCAACAALLDLCYHNTGWVQFGYRFSNDYIVLLIAMIALGRRRFGPAFATLVAWSFAVNLFGAMSFQRPGWENHYRYDIRHEVYFEPD